MTAHQVHEAEALMLRKPVAVGQFEDKTVMTTSVNTVPPYETPTNYGIAQPASAIPFESTKANPTGPQTYVTTTSVASPETPSYIVQQSPQPAPVQYVPVPVFQPGMQSMQLPTMHLGNLHSGAATVQCPRCKMRSLTRIEFHSGNTTHAWAAVFLFVFALPCIPYLMTGLKDVQHYCAHCGTLLATWHKSGRTEVHAYA